MIMSDQDTSKTLLSSVDLYLIPSQGAPEELMATIQPHFDRTANPEDRSKADTAWNALILQNHNRRKKITLEGYTRDGWAWKPNSGLWTTVQVINTGDNRKKRKLHQFVQYLKERQKSAFGRFGSVGVLVVSYVQTTPSNSIEEIDQMDCRIAIDCTKIPGCSLRPVAQPNREIDRPSNGRAETSQAKSVPTAATNLNASKRKSGGFLGKLVGAQQRTNEHVVASKQQRPLAKVVPRLEASKASDDVLPQSTAAFSSSILKSAQEVIASFRQECHDQMLNFDISENEILHIPIVLKDYIQQVDEEEHARITMDILKYIVYEAAEEVNEEWVAYKEPSEFMDEIMITIYKEGAAPEHVLEDIHQAEIPDEIRGQQRAIQEQRTKSVQQAEMKQKQHLDHQIYANEDDSGDDLEALNTKKRDRRTIEDYEREKREQQNVKRSRP